MFNKIEANFHIKRPIPELILQKMKTEFKKNANIDVMAYLNATGNVNRIGIMNTNFEFGLSAEELEKRVQKDYLKTINLLKEDSPEFACLAEGDKKALAHLVKAANILDNVYLKQDNPKNTEFKEFLVKESEKGNLQAKNALILFNAQKGVSAVDHQTNIVNLLKGNSPRDGKGFYPQDLSKEEFHNILISMLENGKIEEVKNVLSQRTMVIRNGKELKGVDYTEAFSKEFNSAADELEKAAQTSTNKDFNEFLMLQAKALRTNDIMLDAKADKKWAELQNTPLEFTVTRENYNDELTGTVLSNEKLAELLKKNNITPNAKDSIGVRVGIINKEGTDFLLKFKELMPILAKEMPYNSEYVQNVGTNGIEQTMVDADIITLTGDEGAYRAGIVLAQNLPNSDKSSFSIGGGRRNVYHRQIRLSANPEKLQKRLDTLLDKSQHSLYNLEADHWFTIGHENAHSLGPAAKNTLGQYNNIIEENKADMASVAFLDVLTQNGFYTKEQKDQIAVTLCADFFAKSKPTLSQAHRVRSLMQANYFIEKGAIEITPENKIKVNIDKVVPAGKEMLKEIIRLQIDGNVEGAKAFIDKYFVWTDTMEKIGQELKKIDKTLNGRISTPLADYLAK